MCWLSHVAQTAACCSHVAACQPVLKEMSAPLAKMKYGEENQGWHFDSICLAAISIWQLVADSAEARTEMIIGLYS